MDSPSPQPTTSRTGSSPKNSDLPARRKGAPLSWPFALGIFCALLVLPLWALIDLSDRIDWRILATAFVIVSSLTFYFYWSDKRKAQHDQWRIPEGTLHLLEILGGWFAGLLAQRFLRHKTRKMSYQAVFWFIGILHQFAAFEWVSHGWLSRSVWQLLQ